MAGEVCTPDPPWKDSSRRGAEPKGLSLNFRSSRITAIKEAFGIVNTNVLEAKQRKQLQAIRAHLDNLEDGGAQVIDV